MKQSNGNGKEGLCKTCGQLTSPRLDRRKLHDIGNALMRARMRIERAQEAIGAHAAIAELDAARRAIMDVAVMLEQENVAERPVLPSGPPPPMPSSEHGTAILVVEDEPLVLESLGYYLEREGFRPRLARSPNEALALFDSDPRVALALVDLSLPEASGTELAKTLRGRNPELPIVWMSADPSALLEAGRAVVGLPAYLQKPFSRAQLMRVVQAVLRASADA